MEGKTNPVQEYVNAINEIRIPDDEAGILDFLSSLDGAHQREFLSFILSQSHIYQGMTEVFENYHHIPFYNQAGYYERYGDKVPVVGEDGKIDHKPLFPYKTICSTCETILQSLQSGDKAKWAEFAKYVKRIYEPRKMDIYRNTELSKLNSDMLTDFVQLRGDIAHNDRLVEEIEKTKNMPVEQKTGFLSGIRNYFINSRRNREISKKESQVQDESKFVERALGLIEKYKNHPNTSVVMKEQLVLAENLIKAGLPKDELMNILNAVSRLAETASSFNYRTFNMLKQLSNNARLARDLYSPEVIYANSFQEMTKNVRLLLIKYPLDEETKITTEYRKTHLKNHLNATESIENILKGTNLSQDEIGAKMAEYDKEFETIMQEKDPEMYVRRCTSLMMKFVSTHPFDDGNGRTSRMLLQVMLARRGILLPSNFDNYFSRGAGTGYTRMEDKCLRSEDYTPMQDYMIDRVKKFNNGKIEFNETKLEFPNRDKQRNQDKSLE